MSVRAIFFDAGNTLLRMNYADIAAALARHGVSATAADVQRAEWTARVRLDTDVLVNASSTESRDTHLRYLRYILEGLGVTDQRTIEAVDAWRRAYNLPVGLWNTADPDAVAALDAVRAARVRSAVISNSNGTIRSLMERLGLIDKLDFVIDSAEEGVEKPDPRIFERALELLGARRETTMHVGDMYHVDIVGARAAGLHAMLFDPLNLYDDHPCERVGSLDLLIERLRTAEG